MFLYFLHYFLMTVFLLGGLTYFDSISHVKIVATSIATAVQNCNATGFLHFGKNEFAVLLFHGATIFLLWVIHVKFARSFVESLYYPVPSSPAKPPVDPKEEDKWDNMSEEARWELWEQDSDNMSMEARWEREHFNDELLQFQLEWDAERERREIEEHNSSLQEDVGAEN